MIPPVLASRASWGARFADGDLTLTGLAAEVFLHHSAGATLAPSASVEAERAQMRGLEQTGQSRFGRGISYNAVVFPSGRAYQGVSWNRRGTHTGGRNSTSRSIAFAGNHDVHPPTDAAIATARAILSLGRGLWWRTDAPLRGHNAVSATACPGRFLMARMGDIVRPLDPDDERWFLMGLTNSEQREVLDAARHVRRDGQGDRFAREIPRRAADALLTTGLGQGVGTVRHGIEDGRVISRRTELEVLRLRSEIGALRVMVATLAEYVGVEPAAVAAAVEAAVSDALTEPEDEVEGGERDA